MARTHAPEERTRLADRYRSAAFALLLAARQFHEAASELSTTKVRVTRPSRVDLADAQVLIDACPDVLAEVRQLLATAPPAAESTDNRPVSGWTS